MNRLYNLYGHSVSSEIDFPLPSRPESDADVRIRQGTVNPPVDGPYQSVSEDEVVLSYPEVGRFELAAGQSITVDPVEASSPTLVKRVLLGRAFGYLMHQRGEYSLHASAVSVDGRGVLFAGPRGSGKSTLAAAFLSQEYNVLVCDISVLVFDNGVPMITPSFPMLKLSPESKSATAPSLDPMMPPVETAEKRYYSVEGAFERTPVPLERIYTIEVSDRKSPRIESLDAQTVIPELVRHTFANSLLEDTDTMPQHFEQCVSVADAVPIKRLDRPDDLDRLVDVVEAVEDDLGV